MDVVVHKIPDTEIAERLAVFEQRYMMRSCDFYDRFRAGELGDEQDYIGWAGLVLRGRTPRRAQARDHAHGRRSRRRGAAGGWRQRDS